MKIILGAGLFVLGFLSAWGINAAVDRNADADRGPDGLAIDSIVLRRSAGFGPGPNYKVSLLQSGRVVYEGYRSLESSQELPTILGRQGVYVGRIDRAAFAKIVNMAVRRGIVGQDGHFSAGIDAEYTSITLAGSTEYGGEATRPLIEEIDSLLSGLVWREAGEAHR